MGVMLASSSSVPLWGLILMAVAGALATLLLVRKGLEDLRQAARLRGVIPLSQLGRHIGASVAVSGTPQGVRGDCLWERKEHQEWQVSYSTTNRRRKRHARWVTVRTEETPLCIVLADRSGATVTVRGEATEMHGTRSSITALGGDDTLTQVLSFIGLGPTRRVRRTWLPRCPRLTACGRVAEERDGFGLLRHDDVGLLLTTQGASEQANVETVKGALCLASPVLYVALLLFLRTLHR